MLGGCEFQTHLQKVGNGPAAGVVVDIGKFLCNL
jgi:hypothetical protein